MRRHLMLSLFVITVGLVVAVVVAVVGCGGGNSGASPPPGPVPAQGAYIGETACATCHADKATEWMTAKHHEALSVLQAIGQGTNPSCIPCHTVGFGKPTGYVDQATTPNLANVQCENCHGPGGNHASDPSNNKMTVDVSASVCGTCHTGFHHPNFEDWQKSKHAVALPSLIASGHARNDCLQCHSVDKRLSSPTEVVLPASVPAQHSLDCVTCHDPHGTPNPRQMRVPLADLCIQCHTDQDAPIAGSPHHNQGEMFLGTGGFDATGAPVVGPNSDHTSAISIRCVQCHVYQVPNPKPTVENPVNTGHTFMPNVPLACLDCHPGDQATTFKAATQAEILGKLAALAPYFTKGNPKFIDKTQLSGAKLTTYQAALFNYNFVTQDKSNGVHNADYARHLLQIAQDAVNTLP